MQACGLDSAGHPLSCPPVLNASGSIAAPFANFSGLTSDVASKDPIVRLEPTTNTSGRWAIDPDGMQVGGDYVPDVAGQGAASGSRGTLGSIRLSCHPYGNYDAGACLTIQDTAFGREGSRAGIGAGLESSVAALASYQSFENVLINLGTSAAPSRLALQNVTYDATHIYAPGCQPSGVATASGTPSSCTPWTASQMGQFRDGMTITTNSIDPNNTAFFAPGTQRVNPPNWGLYAAFVSSWDPAGRWIAIQPGWTIPGAGNAASGQVPSVSQLDSVMTNYKVPTVFLGGEEKDFGMVTQLAYNPQLDSTGHPTTIVPRSFEREEVDTTDYGQIDYNVSWHGFTIAHSVANTTTVPLLDSNCKQQYDPSGNAQHTTRYVTRDPKTYLVSLDSCGQPNGHGVYPTSDSYGLFVAGGFGMGGGSLLRLTAGAGEHEINSTVFNTYGMGEAANAVGDMWEIGEFDGQADSNHLRLVNWVQRTNTNSSGWMSNEYDLGLWVDGDAMNPWAGTTLSGSPMARIAFNHGTNLGGMDLIANNGTDVLSLNGAGNATVNASLSTGGNITAGGQIISTLAIIDQGSNFYFQGSDGTNWSHFGADANGNIYVQSNVGSGAVQVGMPMSVSGVMTAQSGVVVSGGVVQEANFTYASLPGNVSAGSHVFCSNCYIGSGSKGVIALYNGGSWTGMSGEALRH